MWKISYIFCLHQLFIGETTSHLGNGNKHHVYDIHENDLWPFEQFGTLPKTQGSIEALLVYSMIAQEVKLYKRNIYMVWTDVKKAFDSIQQKYIIKILELLEAPA